METAVTTPFSTSVAPAKSRPRLGIALSSVPVAFLIFDASIHLAKFDVVVEAFERMGYPAALSRPLGILESVCLLLYIVPRTSILGAVLLTGFLGGAISSHVRIGDPLWSHVLFPVYV